MMPIHRGTKRKPSSRTARPWVATMTIATITAIRRQAIKRNSMSGHSGASTQRELDVDLALLSASMPAAAVHDLANFRHPPQTLDLGHRADHVSSPMWLARYAAR
ncbi:unnamed protein product [Prorocentrum cordatum]|uniref:Uncharacterized protein n=1 Tax=Prorocentrum cordatum TaxID=2364126 RepID=A0ABN9WTW0_9DINO|nr:unnamed protein product [Polarella glacialis]